MFYIGSAKNFQDRSWRHKRELFLKKHRNIRLQNHINKYGLSDIRIEIIETVKDIKSLIEREQYYIDLYNPWFNLNRIAGSSLGMRHSEKHKEKMRVLMTGRTYSPETIEKMRLARLGTKMSDESKIKMSISRTGEKRTGEALENIINAMKRPDVIEKKRRAATGRKHTEETKIKMRESRAGQIFSEDTRRKMSLSKIGNRYKANYIINSRINKSEYVC